MTIIASRTDNRPLHLRTRRTAWWGIAVLAALVVVIAANPLVTDAAVWLAFAAATRVAVVDRRRTRRAAHRAEVWQRIATAEAVEIGNAHSIEERVA